MALKSIETALAKLLDANKPQKQEVYDPNRPPQLDGIYGRDIKVKVSTPANAAGPILVEFGFGITCGFDSVLLAYERSNGVWEQVLRWQNPGYDSIDAAFGDFFDYVVLPRKGSSNWIVAVAHGPILGVRPNGVDSTWI